MVTVSEQVRVRATPQRAFDVYVGHIDDWWLRQGTYRYSFAPPTTEPAHIRFEAGLGGRFYEEFADGSIHDIGTITTWNPPHEFAYTWKEPQWPEETTVHVAFVADGDHTEVRVTHSGFRSKESADGYALGLREILGSYTDWMATAAIP